MLGTSGMAASRLSPHTAIACILSDFIWPIAGAGPDSSASIWQGRSARGLRGAHRAAGAGLVHHHDRLLGQAAHHMGERARGDVGHAARRKRHEDLDGFGRIGILRHGWPQCRQHQPGDNERSPLHHSLPCFFAPYFGPALAAPALVPGYVAVKPNSVVSASGNATLSRSERPAVLAGFSPSTSGPLGAFQSVMKEATASSDFKVSGPCWAAKAARPVSAVCTSSSGCTPSSLAHAGRSLPSRPVSSTVSDAVRRRGVAFAPAPPPLPSLASDRANLAWPRMPISSVLTSSTLVAGSRV